MSNIFYGTIIASAPEYGIAMVQIGEGAPSMSNVRIGHLPYADASCGTVVQHQLIEGTAVACMAHIDDSTAKVYILGPVNSATGEKDDHLKWRNFYNIDPYKANQHNALDDALNSMLTRTQLEQFRDFAHSVDQDALPGDFDIKDKFGANGMHVGRLLSQLHGSPLAYLDVEALYNTNRRIADRLEDHTITSFKVVTPEYAIENIALDESEAFGLKDTAPFTEEGTDNIELTDEQAIPFYRITRVTGPGIDGDEQLILEFPKDADKHDSSNEPQILAKRRVSLTGSMSQASTASIFSVKSPDITGVLQLGYGGTSKKDPDNPEFDDILEPYEGDVPEDPEDPKPDPADAIISDAAINKIIDKLLSSEYLEQLKKRMLENGLSVSDSEKTLGKTYFEEEDLKPIGGPINAQQYALPKSITLKDPVSGRQQTYYASTSFISQEEDGSILIADGYGSEIRMSRGNIYISPALDLFFRPGRDLSSMVPRHQSYNSQGSCTINSDDAMYVHATKDLKLAGATEGKGVVVLESRSTQDGETPGGLVIRSNRNVSLTGSDVYIGRNAHSNKDRGRTQEPDQVGSVIIDAGSSGFIYERSQGHTVDSQTFVASSTGAGANTAIIVAPSYIGLYAPQVTMPSVLNMQTLEGAQQITLLRDGKETNIALNTSNSIGLIINGSIQATGSLHCNGSGKFCKGLVAKGIISNSMYNSVPDPKDRDIFKEIPADSTPVSGALNTATISVVKQLTKTLYQNYFVVGNEFAFPITYNVDIKLRMPGMLWQVIAEEKETNTSLYKWTERYIKSIDGTETACYPGIEVWKSSEAVISTKEYKTHPLATGYIMNAERTNTDE